MKKRQDRKTIEMLIIRFVIPIIVVGLLVIFFVGIFWKPDWSYFMKNIKKLFYILIAIIIWSSFLCYFFKND